MQNPFILSQTIRKNKPFKCLCLLYCLGGTLLLPGQNLIRNGSFETMLFESCIFNANTDAENVIPPWFGRVEGIWHLECFWNKNGCLHRPKSGERYVTIGLHMGYKIVNNVYVGIELSEPLTAGEQYYFEMNFSDPGFLNAYDPVYINSLGAYLSEEPLDINRFTYHDVSPQISNDLEAPYPCGVWQTLGECFVAKGGERFVTLGFFGHPTELEFGETIGGFIHIDDIALISVDELEQALGPDQENCEGQEVAFTLRAGNPAIRSYRWQDGSTTPTLQVKEPGIYWVEMENECFLIRDTIIIAESDFTVDLGPDRLLCDNMEEMILQSPPDSDNALWNDALRQPNFRVTEPGTYWLQADRNGCSAYDTIIFYTNEQLSLSLGGDTSLCTYDLPYSLQIIGTPDPEQIQWQDGKTGGTYPVTGAGTYQATLSNECGVQSREVSIQVEDCTCSLYLPNAFSPNNDGVNDILRAYLECIYSQINTIDLKIFDRWGNQLFHTVSLDEGWDGTVLGKSMPIGVYIWQLIWEESLNDGLFRERVESGEVYLLR